ncbi:MAG: thioesterase [Gammaproteobacteria bacterium]|nr:thioesterase [Gammaproteobacteria bacterium]
MNLLFRLAWLLITAPGRKRIGLTEECELLLRVLPTDLDLNLHLTNARYLSMMDLGRTELILQTGMLKELLKRRWLPVVAVANLKFYRQINPFQRYKVITRIIGWDEKWFYIEQRFMVKGKVAAVGVIKGLFRGKEGKIPTEELLKLAGHQGEPPEMSDELVSLLNS